MTVYARLCGWTLARAHARSGDRVALAAYLGGSAKFDQAIAEFAETYADQNARDYAAFQAAVKEGKVAATPQSETASGPRASRATARLTHARPRSGAASSPSQPPETHAAGNARHRR